MRLKGWLRTYYPLEFLTTALNINKDNEDKTAALTSFLNKVSIEIKIPVFGKAKGEYFCDKKENCIYKGVGSIKYLNNSVADQLYELSKKRYDSFIDLLIELKNDSVLDSRQLTTLIKIDYFQKFGNIKKLLFVYKVFDNLYNSTAKIFKKQISKSKVADYGLTDEIVRLFSHKETEKTYMMIDMYGLLKAVEEENFGDIPTEEKASYQQSILKKVYFIDKNKKGIAVISDVNAKYSPSIKAYALANGGTVDFRIPKEEFNRNKLEEGDVIRILNYKYRPKQRRVAENKYEEVPGEKVLWVMSYYKVFDHEE